MQSGQNSDRRWAILQGEQLANSAMLTQLMTVVVVQTPNSENLLRMIAGLVDKMLSNTVITAEGPNAETLKTLTIESARRTVDELMTAIAAFLDSQRKS
ncbi:MAG: hypothetical protein QM773_05515 [Hyphomonadaceae bacterium]